MCVLHFVRESLFAQFSLADMVTQNNSVNFANMKTVRIVPTLATTINSLYLLVLLPKGKMLKTGVNTLPSVPLLHSPRIGDNLEHCKCVVLHDILQNKSSPNFENFMTSVAGRTSGTVTVQFQSSGNLTILNSSVNSQGVRKSENTCIFGIVYVSNARTLEHLERMYNFLKLSNGIVRTDNDFFLFISQSESILDQLLISESFGKRIKFGMAVVESALFARAPVLTFRLRCDFCENLETTEVITTRWATSFIGSLYVDRTQNYMGRTLQVSTPISTRWLNEMNTVDQKWLPKRGIYSIVLKQLQLRYNFTVFHFPSTGGGTGSKVNQTYWVGTVGDVLTRKADIGHVTAMTFQRFTMIEGTFPISYEWLTFTTGQAATHHSWKIIYRPFTRVIWQLTAITCVLGILLFKSVLIVTGQRSHLGKIIEYMLAVVTEEGVRAPEEYPTHSVRVTIVLWLVFGLIMSTAYRSKLTAFLAFPNVEPLPQTFEDLATSPYGIGLQYIKGAAYQILKSSKNPTYVTIFKRMELEESDVKCFKRTLASKFACISWDSIADYAYHKNLTDKFGHAPVVKSPASTLFLTAGLIMEKRSILKSSFDHFIIWAMDTGMISKWRAIDHDYVAIQRKLWERETNQPETDYTPPERTALTLAHLSGSYLLFTVGILSGVAAFIGELLHKQYAKHKDLRKSGSAETAKGLIDIKFRNQQRFKFERFITMPRPRERSMTLQRIV